MVDLASENPRFLISSMGSIGGTIMTLPVLCALRDRFPNAQITWVVEKKSAQVVEGHPDLDQLIVLERRWFKSPREVWQLRKRLKQSKIDVAVDAQSKTKSALVCRLSGAKVRIGCKKKYGREFRTMLNNTLIEPSKPHLVDRALGLLQPLGIDSPDVHFRLPIKSNDAESIDQFIQASHLACGFAVINPGATRESKRWPAERFGQVARALGERRKLPSVISWAGNQELDWAQSVVDGSGGHALLAPETSLGELSALLDRSCMYIGNATGPMHMAVAVGAPCVCLHGPTRPQDCGPYGERHIAIIQRHVNASHRRNASNEVMRSIQVDQVVQACEEILQRDAVSSDAA